MALVLHRLNGRTPLWVSLSGAVVALFLGIYAVVSSASHAEGRTVVRLAEAEKDIHELHTVVEDLMKRRAADDAETRFWREEIVRRLDRIENKLDGR